MLKLRLNVKVPDAGVEAGYLTAESTEQRRFLGKTAQSKVNEANTRKIWARLNQDIFNLDVPVKDFLILKFFSRFNQLSHYYLRERQQEEKKGSETVTG